MVQLSALINTVPREISMQDIEERPEFQSYIALYNQALKLGEAYRAEAESVAANGACDNNLPDLMRRYAHAIELQAQYLDACVAAERALSLVRAIPQHETIWGDMSIEQAALACVIATTSDKIKQREVLWASSRMSGK
jgi:hypothetical protein